MLRYNTAVANMKLILFLNGFFVSSPLRSCKILIFTRKKCVLSAYSCQRPNADSYHRRQRRITFENCVIAKLLNALMPPLLDELDDFTAMFIPFI